MNLRLGGSCAAGREQGVSSVSPTTVPAPVPAECSQPRAHGGQPLRALKRHGSGGSALSDEGDGRLRGQSDVSWRMLWGGGDTRGALPNKPQPPHLPARRLPPRLLLGGDPSPRRVAARFKDAGHKREHLPFRPHGHCSLRCEGHEFSGLTTSHENDLSGAGDALGGVVELALQGRRQPGVVSVNTLKTNG